MFTRLGRFTVRRRRRILVLTALFIVAAAGLGSAAFGRLQDGGFNDPGSESSRATHVLNEQFHTGDPNVVVLLESRSGLVDGAAATRQGLALTRKVAATPGNEQVASYWSLGGAPALRSTDGAKAIIVARITGSDAQVADTFDRLRTSVADTSGALTVRLGGVAAVNHDAATQITQDLASAETFSVPITLVLLVLVFGGLVAAGLPLAVAVIAVVGTLFALFATSLFTDVSIYAINLTTALGLGLAIDYSLLIVTRYREELARGLAPDAAVVRTVETAGRTVAFSALIVAASLSALIVFPLFFLRSFAYAGASVVLIAALGALVSLPALLAVVGTRVNSLRVFRHRPREVGTGFWHRLAGAVMRRPILIGTAVIVALLALGAPFLRVNFGLPGPESLPKGAESRVVSESLLRDFQGDSGNTFAVVTGLADPARHAAEISRFAEAVSRLPGVSRVEGLTGHFEQGARTAEPGPASAQLARLGGTWLTVVPSVAQVSPRGEQLVKDIRSLDAPFPFAVEGKAAELVDTKEAIFSRLPLALAMISVITFVLLFLVFGSVLVPVKAIVLNMLSLSATFGLMVWIFQEGHLSSVLGFTANGTLSVTMPILMFCIAFGLSMDYEVFLLSRIKEEYDATGDNEHSVAVGLERTGRLVTAAAALLAVTFMAFGTSQISFIKLFGIGLAVAIVMDATIIRGLLVPAFMRLAGDANWWAPRWMRAIHDRVGIDESGHRGEVPESLAA
jgi:RND superfamily putative drug exporter